MNFDIEIGKQGPLNKPVFLYGEDRLRNNLLLGPNGSGTTVLLLHMIHQDIKKMKDMLENGEEHINSLSLIDRDGGLGQRVLAIARQENIPENRVTYLHPSQRGKNGFNPLKGEYSDVLYAFINMLENHFLSLPVHEKEEQIKIIENLLFILKHSGEEPSLEQLVESFIKPEKLVFHYYKLIDELEAAANVSGEVLNNDVSQYLYEWLQIYIDIEIVGEEATCNFKPSTAWNHLSDVFQSLVEKETLFSSKSSVDLQDIFNRDGILLVAPADLEASEAELMIGKYILSRMERASYNGNLNRPGVFHSVVVTDAISFIYRDFYQWLNKSSSLGTSVTIVERHLSRWKDKYGEGVLLGAIEGLSNVFTFGGLTVQDARLMAKLFSAGGLQETELSSKDLMTLDLFTTAARLVRNGYVLPVQQMTVNYIPN